MLPAAIIKPIVIIFNSPKSGHPALPRGEYQLSQHVGERCVYPFCMCPGGQVVASASEKRCVVTNGMSSHARSGKNANAAVVAVSYTHLSRCAFMMP